MEIKITAIKFETVNGRKTGKSFSFGMDPKKMAKYKTEATVRKKIEEYVAKNGVFKREELKDLRYDMKEFLEEWRKQLPIVEEEEGKNREESVNNPESRVTPDVIKRLANNEIFVFGSNEHGLHYGGAARYALDHFGAIMGQGVGLQGQSYGIPTMQGGVETIRPYVDEFIEFAKQHSELTFLVTRIGCGIAGFTDEEIAPLFKKAHELENVVLPEGW